MQINLKTLKIKNFLSTGQNGLTYQLDQYKTNLIVGKNGHGKSLMIDALCYVLFGRPFRKINKPQLINSINQRNMLVEIEFEVGATQFRIERGMKPTVLNIWSNGILLDQSAAKGDPQNVIEKEILRMNFKTFCQIVILGKASYVPFMELTSKDRREIVEDLLDLEIYSVMMALTKEQIDDTSKSIQLLTSELTVIDSQRVSIEKQLNQQENVDSQILVQLDQQIASVQQDIATKQLEMDNLLAEINDLKTRSTKIPDVRQKTSKLNGLLVEANHHIRDSQKHIRLLSENDKCPVCHQMIEMHFKNENVAHETHTVAQYQQAIGQIEKKLEYLQSISDKKLETLEKINQLNQKVILCKNMMHSAERHITSLRETKVSNLSITSNSIADSKRALKEIIRKIKTTQMQLKTVKETHALLQFAQMLLRDGGLKAQVIKRYVPKINQLINEYLATMDFFVSFELNENFEETIKSRYRDEFSYNSFSEGEKVRINLAILFAWRSIAKIKNSVNVSLLIFDEVFDGSLDNVGSEDFAKLMSAVSDNTNVWVISHNEPMTERFENIIEVVKEKNFSTFKE